jgi:hypothetical protein
MFQLVFCTLLYSQKTWRSVVLLCCFLLATTQSFSQFSDSFADGDFTANPVWTGNNSKFIVSTNRLKLQAPAVNDNAYLSTPSEAINNATWEFFVRIEFNPSSSNYTRVYLSSDGSDLSGALHGYFVGIGNASDEISLYKQNGTTTIEIIDGLDNRLNIATADIKIKVTRDDSGNWALYTDVGSGTYVAEGNAVDSTFVSSAYFGIYCLYTSTRSDKFYFDDFSISGDPFVDDVAPEWLSLSVNSSTKLKLTFSEKLDSANAIQVSKYAIDDIGNPESVIVQNESEIVLTFSEPFPNGHEQLLHVSQLVDTAGNVMQTTSKSFLYFLANPVSYRDIIITEVFPDYSPTVGLPENEFVEIFNRSENPVQLSGWTITDGTSTGILSSEILLPGEYAILTSSGSSSAFTSFGTTVSVSNFPTLNNTGDYLLIKDNSNQHIDSLRYTSSWFKDDDKKLGGWTLELIDPENTCKGDENWIASNDTLGGTPGSVNSVYETIIDTEGPRLMQVSQISADEIELTFDEKLGGSLPLSSQIAFDPPLAISNISFSDATFKSLSVSLSEALVSGKTYLVTINDIADCPGNMIGEFNHAYMNLDTIPPTIDSMAVLSVNSLLVRFSEVVSEQESESVQNYSIASGHPITADLQNDDRTILLTFANNFENGRDQQLDISSIPDINNNMANQSVDFMFFQPSLVNQRDIVITEIFPDPTPAVGMPEFEFLEIYNRSANAINLKGWRLTDGNTQATLSEKIVLPNDYLILCTGAGMSQFQAYGSVLSIANFPSLNNSADHVVLKDADSVTIDSLYYSRAWYRNEDKEDGGWTLELRDVNNVCLADANWIASIHESGGTPGQINSVSETVIDVQGPKLITATIIDSTHVQVSFDERLSSNLPSPLAVEFSPSIPIASLDFADNDLISLKISLTAPIVDALTYRITVRDVYDCAGNLIQGDFRETYLNYDTIAPMVDSSAVVNNSVLQIRFHEKINPASVTLSNFTVKESGHPSTIGLAQDQRTVILTFDSQFKNGVEYFLHFENISDINGNLGNDSLMFVYFIPSETKLRDVIITEILADPSPVTGMPEAEFVEIVNRSENPINTQGWQMTDGSTVGELSERIILPGEYYILTSYAALTQFQTFGKTIAVSDFPSLNNSGDLIVLKDAVGNTIDSIHFSSSWYHDTEKNDGGFSLELANPNAPCKGALNWSVSMDTVYGGTPGRQNSLFNDSADVTGPQLRSITLADSSSIKIEFDEILMPQLSAIAVLIEPDLRIDSMTITKETLQSIQLFAQSGIVSEKTYQITLEGVSDCIGNESELIIGILNPDTLAPAISAVKVTSIKSVLIEFSEAIDTTSIELSDFDIDGFNVISFGVYENQTSLELFISESFTNGIEQHLSVTGIIDINGNALLPTETTFVFFEPKSTAFKDVIITEIFADPTPIIGLPEAEFVEIYNRSVNPISLEGWALTDGVTIGKLPFKIILPGEYLILTGAAAITQYEIFGKTVSISNFPSLNNSGDAIVIKDAFGNKIDSVYFSSAWFVDDDKKGGGWTLELISLEHLCKGASNWKASVSNVGGTPGTQNSQHNPEPDNEGPQVLQLNQEDSVSVQLEFDESLSGAMPIINTTPELRIHQVKISDAGSSAIQVLFDTEVIAGKTYAISIEGLRDCIGNLSPGINVTLNPDSIPPLVQGILVTSANTAIIIFSEKLNPDFQTSSFEADGLRIKDAVLQQDKKSIKLEFLDSLLNGVEQKLRIANLSDINGNVMPLTEWSLMLFQEKPITANDIVITEIFADPSPIIGLPELEFVEIFNRSDNPISLENFSLSDGSSTTNITGGIILPDQYVILCAYSAVSTFSAFGKTLGVANFPSLNNSDDILVLRHANLTIDSVNYTDEWYCDDEKRDGGYSLELIDPENTCAEDANWIASENGTGGTPGRQNSVYANKPDVTGPQLLTAIPDSETTLVVSFNEKLSTALPLINDFSISQLSIESICFTDVSLRKIRISITDKFVPGLSYQLSAQNIFDCSGNIIQPGKNTVTFGLPETPSGDDLVINEVLFNPRPTGVDFVEFYNNSGKYLNLKNWSIANIVNDTLEHQQVITGNDFLVTPHSYFVLTASANTLKGEYLQGREETFIEMDNMPSMNDDEGSIALLDSVENVIDHFIYSSDFHSPFIQNPEGVSLERVVAGAPTNEAGNWKSAGEQSGFATPGYANSNSITDIGLSDQAIHIEPQVFEPVFGQPNFTMINYQFDRGGFVGNIKIVDSDGREIRTLAENMLLNTEGFFRWDGDENNGAQARIGRYMIWFEVFDDQGQIYTFRKPVAIAGKF